MPQHRFIVVGLLIVANATTFIIRLASAFAVVPSWDHLQSLLQPPIGDLVTTPSPPVYNYNEFLLHNSSTNDDCRRMPILYRDEECIDIACEIVWLALECKNVEYVTVLVPSSSSKTGDANDHNNNAVGVVVPRIVWPDDDTFDENIDSSSKNKIINDPIKLLEQIQLHYPTHPPNFYPRVS